jgi:hypothetical protein
VEKLSSGGQNEHRSEIFGAGSGGNSRDRAGKHPQAHLANYTGIFQADAYDGYGKLYEQGRRPGPILEAACWVHARRPFFVMADLAENARRKAQGKKPVAISPLALEAVRRIDELFEIERAINGQSPERRSAVRQELSVSNRIQRRPPVSRPRATLLTEPRPASRSRK